MQHEEGGSTNLVTTYQKQQKNVSILQKKTQAVWTIYMNSTWCHLLFYLIFTELSEYAI